MDLVRPERDDLFLVLWIVKISPCLELTRMYFKVQYYQPYIAN
jgi:hypothetical protein